MHAMCMPDLHVQKNNQTLCIPLDVCVHRAPTDNILWCYAASCTNGFSMNGCSHDGNSIWLKNASQWMHNTHGTTGMQLRSMTHDSSIIPQGWKPGGQGWQSRHICAEAPACHPLPIWWWHTSCMCMLASDITYPDPGQSWLWVYPIGAIQHCIYLS